MVENDTSTYQAEPPGIEQKNRVVHALITQERIQKLELLIHLLSNSGQALIICGPEGIGKSTLLNVLRETQVEPWFYCPVQGHADLSFDRIEDRIIDAIGQDQPDKQAQALADIFRLAESRHKKIVLMIDDAGHLAPGLIDKIIEYAEDHPVLRVIFALTHDDLSIKNRSDAAVDDCHLIEIPPLSEQQCGEFLQHLSANPRSKIAFNEINDGMIEAVYRQTHGIPGRIAAEFPDVDGAKKSGNPFAMLIAAVAGLVVLALVIQWFSNSKYNTKPVLAPAADAPKLAEPPSPVVAPPAAQRLEQAAGTDAGVQEQGPEDAVIGNLSEPGTAPAVIDKLNKPETNDQPIVDQALNDALLKPAETTDNTPAIKPPPQTAPANEEPAEVPVDQNQNEGEQWLMEQPIDNYTLQVMVLSKEQLIQAVVMKYPLLAQNLRYIKEENHGRPRFVLLYGSFTSLSLAIQAKKSLPPEFRQAVARKISAIKK